jgi:hypothetical protein
LASPVAITMEPELASAPPAAPEENVSLPEAAFARAVAAVTSSIAPLPAPPAPERNEILPPSPVGSVEAATNPAASITSRVDAEHAPLDLA